MLKLYKIIVFGLLAAFTTGCISTTPNFGLKQSESPSAASSTAEQASIKELSGDTAFIKVENLPIHSKMVLAALLQKMRKQNITVDGVNFDPKGNHEIDSEYSDFTGYNVSVFEIDWESSVPINNKTNTVFLRGVFTFMNAVGQTLSEQFFVDYNVTTGKPIIINNSVTIPIYPDTPTVIGFFLEHKVLASAVPYLSTFKDFYLFASLNNINMHATEEEKINNDKYEKLSFFEKMKNTDLLTKPKDTEFAFLAFCMDRISPLGRYTIKISENPGGQSISSAQPEYLMFEDGFTIGMIQAKGKLFSLQSKFYIQADYAKNDTVDQPIKVAQFSSLKYFNPGQTFNTPPGSDWIQSNLTNAEKTKSKARPTQVKAASNQTTYSTTSKFLNPKNIEDAKLIQQALKDRGYYTSKIDGLFGKGSLRALQAFRKDAMGDDSVKWDMETQKRLFP